ncbi:uncharacterized protein LAJ45_01171 [Morchella importuna]|uniref:uncharacterized protein n=1 Tax=Morchella importuna TaxID=1174673 RepID=UPI001E8DC209|nr:uncharacterized protein LAJ45_01171 [Morchella importuna]KAH8154643.1 hypothetical protein LAJ45_01171 [Morchella importuna]
MPAPDPKTPLNRRASMPVPSTAMGPPEFTPSSSRTPKTRSSARIPKTQSFPRPSRRRLSPPPASSQSTALPTSGEASSAPVVTPARPQREYGTFDSPFIPDIHPTPSAVSVVHLDEKYRAQQRENTAWMLATKGTLSSSPGIRIEEVADEDSDEQDRENFDDWCREERRKRRVEAERERERRKKKREEERRERKEMRAQEERKEQEEMKEQEGRREGCDEW